MEQDQSRRTWRTAISKGFDYTGKLKDAQRELSERDFELRDLVSIPVATSLSGLALVIHGSRKIDTLQGVIEVSAGRGFDLIDGFLARSLDQESDMGAAVDAVSDKIGMGVIVAQAWHKRVVPRGVLSAVVASNVVNAGLTSLAVWRHPRANYRPPAEGKHAMVLYNAAILCYAYAHAFENEHADRHLHEPLRLLGAGAAMAGTALAVPAAATYARRAGLKTNH